MKHPPAEPLGSSKHGITFFGRFGKVMPFLFLLQRNQAVEAGRSYAFCGNREKVYRQRKKKEEMSSPMGGGAHHYQNGTMKVLELFAGTRSIGKAFEQRGHEVFSVEWSKDFENIDLYEDISKVTAEDILKLFGKPDVIWASPDCTTFSIAAISHHRKKNPETGSLEPVSAYAKFCDRVDKHVLELIGQLQPKYYFIENPRGGMRKMEWMKNLPRYTVTYCQYGDNRMKPTDIWTNHPNPKFLPMCHNGDPCHVPAPRGSKTGTQGLKGSRERSVIPQKLCEHIVDIREKG